MSGLSASLLATLQDLGLVASDGVTRAARISRCESCGASILRGLDGDRAAMTAVCDPREIDVMGELCALALGLRTYTLTRSASSKGMAWNLDPRTPWSIAAGQNTPLVAQHRCGIALPRAAQSRLPRVDHSATQFEDPPF